MPCALKCGRYRPAKPQRKLALGDHELRAAFEIKIRPTASGESIGKVK
jgi:hypothetical protein